MGYVKTHRRRDICLLIISVPFAILSIIALTLPIYFEDVIDILIKQNLQLEENTQQWDWFMDIPVPINFNVNVFDLKNADEVRLGAKPIFEEIGPYVFTEKRIKKKDSIEFIGDTVNYRQDQFIEFDETASYPLSVTDNFTSVNVIYMIVTQIMENVQGEIPFDVEETIENVYGNADVIDTYNIGNLFFDGLYICDPETTTVNGKIICLMITMLHLRFVSYFPNGSMKLSLFDYKNGKDSGLFNINRGTKDIGKIGLINSWDGKTRTDYWNGENNECDYIAESREGTLFGPKITGQDFKLFSTDICRTVQLKVESTETEFDGIGTYKYVLDENVFKSEDPDGCYCVKKTKGIDGENFCFMDGTMDMHSCLGIPAVLSLPHFLHADPKYLQLIDGLSPEKEKHATFIQLEPLSGAPLTGALGIQFNFVVRPIKLNGVIIESTSKLQPAMFPLAWVAETTKVDGDLLDMIKTMTSWYEFFDVFKWILAWILVAIFAVPSIWVMCEVYATKRQDSVIKATEIYDI